MAVGETPGHGCQSGSKSSLEFLHANTMKCLRFVWITVSNCRKQTGPPDAENNLWKSHFIMGHVTKYSTIRGVFQQPWPGVSPTAILNEEKALGTRLQLFLLCKMLDDVVTCWHYKKLLDVFVCPSTKEWLYSVQKTFHTTKVNFNF